MKHPELRIPGALYSELLSNFTEKQLELIGSIAIAYNGCEHVLHNLAGCCIGFPKSTAIITSRINGTDGLVAIVMEASAAFKTIDKEALALIDHVAERGLFPPQDLSRRCSPFDAVQRHRVHRTLRW